jgi:hypothetical protein
MMPFRFKKLMIIYKYRKIKQAVSFYVQIYAEKDVLKNKNANENNQNNKVLK